MTTANYVHKDILEGLKKLGYVENWPGFSDRLKENLVNIEVQGWDDGAVVDVVDDPHVKGLTLAWLVKPGWDNDPAALELTLASIVKGQKIGYVKAPAPGGFSWIDWGSGFAHGWNYPFRYNILRDPVEVDLRDFISYEDFIKQLKSKEMGV